MRVPGPPLWRQPRQADTEYSLCYTSAVGGAGQEAICSLPAVGKEDQGCSHQPVPWVPWVQRALVWGSLYPDAPCGSCRFGLGGGQCAWFAPQGILTKLDQTCKTEIPLKYCSYIFSWTVSLSGHSGLCACLAPQPRAVEQLPLMIGVCPPFCGHISLHRLFLEKIFFCAHTFVTRVKIKHRGHWFPRKSESTSLWV